MMDSAPRVMVISLQKAGTHLMQGLMSALGYKMSGVPRPTPDNTPEFDDEQLLGIASLTRSRAEYEQLQRLRGQQLRLRTRDDWAALCWAWQRRLGQRVVNRYGLARLDFADEVISNPHISYTKFADTPAGLCWVYHELDMDKVDGTFLDEWVGAADPPLIFNYRDPRDTVVSMINFLEGRTPAGYGNFYEFDVFHRILTAMDSWEDKIDYALRDPSFLGRNQFERSLWLLAHPDVCKVRFEDLVGPNGGGSRERQVESLARLLRHIGSRESPEALVDKVYDRDSWSFSEGRLAPGVSTSPGGTSTGSTRSSATSSPSLGTSDGRGVETRGVRPVRQPSRGDAARSVPGGADQARHPAVAAHLRAVARGHPG